MPGFITRKGRDIFTFRLRGAPAAGTEPLNVGWGQGNPTTPTQFSSAVTDVAMFAELPEARVAGTSSQQTTTTGNDTYRVTATITASATRTVTECCLAPTTTKPQSTTVSSGTIIGSASATGLTVASAAGFPGAGNYYAQIRTEVVQITAGQGTANWTVVRGANGSTAISTIAAADTVTGGNGGNDTAVTNGDLFVHADHGSNALASGDSIAYTLNVQMT